MPTLAGPSVIPTAGAASAPVPKITGPPMQHRRVVLALLILAATATSVPAQPNRVTRGKLRNLSVEVMIPVNGQPVPPYIVHLTVAAEEVIDGQACWKLVFFTGDQAPPGLRWRFFLHADKDAGWPRKLVAVKSAPPPLLRIERIGDASLILGSPAGIPLDTLPALESREFRAGDALVNFVKTRDEQDTILDLTYTRAVRYSFDEKKQLTGARAGCQAAASTYAVSFYSDRRIRLGQTWRPNQSAGPL